MITSGSDLGYKPLRVRDKYFSKRCLTKELSMANFSLEDYHGDSSVSVPFNWESEPGTPKVKYFQENPLPPLTPPPSHCYTSTKRPTRKPSKFNLLQAIFPKHASSSTKTRTVPPSPAFSPSSSSSSSTSSPRLSSYYSVPSSPISTPWKFRGRRGMSSPRLSVDTRVNIGKEYRSTLCLFGRGSNRSRATH